MPQDLTIEQRKSQIASELPAHMQGDYKHLIKETGSAGAIFEGMDGKNTSTKGASKTNIDSKTFSYYESLNPAIENNISLMFKPKKTGKGYDIDWKKRIVNIANNVYGDKIQELWISQGKTKTEATNNWRTLHNNTREMLQLLSQVTLELDKNGAVKEAKGSKGFATEKDYNRFNELMSSFETDWNNAERSLLQYSTKEGDWKNLSTSSLKYIYDEERDVVSKWEDYRRINNDILPGDKFATDLEGMDPHIGLNRWIEHNNFLDPRIAKDVTATMNEWALRIFNNVGDDKKSNFKNASQWDQNRNDADTFFRQVLDMGIASDGIGNYTKEELLELSEVYDASAGGTGAVLAGLGGEGDPYDLNKQRTWLAQKNKKILDIVSSMSDRQHYELYNEYIIKGGGAKLTRPGVSDLFDSSKDAKKYDDLQNRVNDFILEMDEVRHTYADLKGQTIREMKDWISSTEGISKSDIYTHQVFGNPIQYRRFFGEFYLDGANNRRGKEDLLDLLKVNRNGSLTSQSKQKLGDDYIKGKKLNYRKGGLTFHELSGKEQTRLQKGWEEDFAIMSDLGGMLEYIARDARDARHGAKTFDKEFSKFTDKFATTFGELDASHVYKRSSLVGGYKMSGNYSIRQEYLDFKSTHADKEQNEKNQNGILILDMFQEGFQADVNNNIFNKEGEYISSEDTSPTVFFTSGKFNHSLDVGDIEQLNEQVVGGTKDTWGSGTKYTKENQEKFFKGFVEKTKSGDWDMEYFNTTVNGDYKAYTFTKRKPTAAEKKTGTDSVTLYIRGDHAVQAGEGFASHEYNDSSDFVFDTKGSYSLTGLQELGGRSKTNTEWHDSGSPRIKGLNLVHINGSKYVEYKELNPSGTYDIQRTYLGASHSLTVAEAEVHIKDLLRQYKEAKDLQEMSPDTPMQEIIANSIL